MFEINRTVTRRVIENYYFSVDEKIMAELNHYLDTEFGIAPITEDEAAAFMAIYCGYGEYNCPADYLSSKYTARAKELCKVEGWNGQECSIFLYRVVGEFFNDYVWSNFKETIDSDIDCWDDKLYITKGR